MSPEQIPSLEHRRRLMNRIGRLASRIDAPDPELYAMVLISTWPKTRQLADWRHLRNMAAVQFELVTNVNEVTEEQSQELSAIEAKLKPQLNRLRNFKEGWHHRSPALRAALQDVGIIQQKLYSRDRPSKKVMR